MEGLVDAKTSRREANDNYEVLGMLDHDQRESAVSTCKNFSIESEKKFALVQVAAGRGRNHLKDRLRTKADIWDAGGGSKCLARPGRPRDEHHVGTWTWPAVERRFNKVMAG